MPYNANEIEQEILKHWDKTDAFKKSIEQRPEDNPYVFYDGPPFATGLPHYGHILSSVIKDVVPRYWTMKGHRVRRRWGWDCHGLPIEQLVEKDLEISGKKDIEDKIGVEKFNQTCQSKVLKYTKDWKTMVDRIGRWVEFDDSYKTMDATYMESVWWSLKTIWDKEMIYEGRKVLMYCPRCETPVSKAEIAMDNSYKDITEETATVKFRLRNHGTWNMEHGLKENDEVFILAWTTTPWTLPGNVALAVGKDIDYVVVDVMNAEHIHDGDITKVGGIYIVAKDRFESVFREYISDEDEIKGGHNGCKIIKELKGSDLVRLEYEPLYKIEAVKNSDKKAWYVTDADFVTTEEGTGIVHTAVIYGEDDYALGVKIDLPMVPMLDERGHFNNDAPEFIRGKYFKGVEKDIKKNLDERGLMFEKKSHTHSYPHCWRCDTPLFYNAISAWFINLQKIKPRLIELNEKIDWFPEHIKHGRFLNILETAPDWNISRNRYWATALPFWKCENEACGHVVCVGSVAELKEHAINYDEVYSTDNVEELDLHKHNVDKIKFQCEKCNSQMSRIPEVIDCWVESASMPFAEFHYPFENKETFKSRFPGQYIAEYIAQTRAWFYYMHVMSTLLFDDVGFTNCVTTGTILNDKGEKLSKSKQNYPDPWKIIETYGVDALRYYLMTSVVMQAENLNFNEREVRDAYNNVINTVSNVLTFYKMFEEQGARSKEQGVSEHVLDKWILAKLQELIKEVTEHMDGYDTVKAGRPIKVFINELSTWYVRRSRDRFKGEDEQDKTYALATLRHVLMTLSKVMAPFTPFISEKMYQDLGGELESVHLEMWPEMSGTGDEGRGAILKEMEVVRKVVELGLSARAEAGMKVRQPLQYVRYQTNKLSEDLEQIIAEELNVKEVKHTGSVQEQDGRVVKEDAGIKVGLNTEITDELKKEGLLREVVRTINQMRKEQGLSREHQVTVSYRTDDELLKSVFVDFEDELKKLVLADSVEEGDGEEKTVDGKVLFLIIKKV